MCEALAQPCEYEFASWRRCISARCGSARRTHWCLCDGGTRGTSALLLIFRFPTSRSCAWRGSHVPEGVRVSFAVLSRQSTKELHMLGAMLCRVPLALCRSLYSGAINGRMCLLRDVAQLRRPSAASRSLRCTLLCCRSAVSCSLSLCSFARRSSTVSVSVRKSHPHQVTLCENCAFFQLMGACKAESNATIRAAPISLSTVRSSASKSST